MKKIVLSFMVLIGAIFIAANFSYADKGGQGKGSAVSKAAHKAQSEGLKGQELAEKVHEAIDQRKEEKGEEQAEIKEKNKEGEENKEKRQQKLRFYKTGRGGKEKE